MAQVCSENVRFALNGLFYIPFVVSSSSYGFISVEIILRFHNRIKSGLYSAHVSFFSKKVILTVILFECSPALEVVVAHTVVNYYLKGG